MEQVNVAVLPNSMPGQTMLILSAAPMHASPSVSEEQLQVQTGCRMVPAGAGTLHHCTSFSCPCNRLCQTFTTSLTRFQKLLTSYDNAFNSSHHLAQTVVLAMQTVRCSETYSHARADNGRYWHHHVLNYDRLDSSNSHDTVLRTFDLPTLACCPPGWENSR